MVQNHTHAIYIFNAFDVDGSGFLSYRELTSAFACLGMTHSEKEIEDLWNSMDLNEDH